MIYPKDNSFTLSSNPHSLGIQNNMTIAPTFGSPNFLAQMATLKAAISQGAIKKVAGTVANTSGPSNNIWGR